MYARKWQYYQYLGITYLIKTMISVFLFVVITIFIRLKFYINSMPYVMISLPCMTSSIFTLRLFIGWFRYKYWKYSRTTIWIWFLSVRYLVSFILLIFYSGVLIQILKFNIFFKYILRKRNFCTLTPSYLGNVSFETVTMAVNSP